VLIKATNSLSLAIRGKDMSSIALMTERMMDYDRVIMRKIIRNLFSRGEMKSRSLFFHVSIALDSTRS